MTSVDRKEMRQKLGLTKFTIGTAARMDPMKRLDRFIEMAAMMQKLDWEAVIIGDGDKNYYSQMQAISNNLGVSDRIRFLGFRDDALDVINAFDAFFLSSQDEPFGLAILEAMLLGIPSFALLDSGGPVESLKGDERFLAEDCQGIANRIENLASNPDLLLQYKTLAKEIAAELDIANTANNLERIYRNIAMQ